MPNSTDRPQETGVTDAPEDDSPGAESPQPRSFFERLIGAFSPDDIDAAVDPAADRLSASMVPGLLNLRRMRVEDVSVPHSDIIAVPVTLGMNELVETFRDSGLTRLPVFEGTLDTPLGFVNLKDFALRHGFNGGGEDFDLRAMVRPLLYVPPSMPLGVLLQKMQTERIHMALVIDEYGGTDGLLTIEDLVETVVGEIEDEHDIDEDSPFLQEKPGVWLALARTSLEDFEDETGLTLTDHDDIDDEEVDSLGGLVFMLAGHVPARGEVILHPDGHEFEVVEADPRRIKRLRVRLANAG